jgi:hypothetical protein
MSDYDLREWKRHLRQEKLNDAGRTRKSATINAKLAALKNFLRWSVRAKLIKAVPELPPGERLGSRSVKWLDTRQQRQRTPGAARPRSQVPSS